MSGPMILRNANESTTMSHANISHESKLGDSFSKESSMTVKTRFEGVSDANFFVKPRNITENDRKGKGDSNKITQIDFGKFFKFRKSSTPNSNAVQNRIRWHNKRKDLSEEKTPTVDKSETEENAMGGRVNLFGMPMDADSNDYNKENNIKVTKLRAFAQKLQKEADAIKHNVDNNRISNKEEEIKATTYAKQNVNISEKTLQSLKKVYYPQDQGITIDLI